LIGCEKSKIIKRALIINLDKLSDEEDLPHWDNFTEEEQDYILTIIQYPEILEDI
jgi:hypothetical protein